MFHAMIALHEDFSGSSHNWTRSIICTSTVPSFDTLSKMGIPIHRIGRVKMTTRQVGLVPRFYVPPQRAPSPISSINCITYAKSGTFFLARKLSSGSNYQCSQRALVLLLRPCARSLSSFSQQQIPYATKSMASPHTVIVVTSCSLYTMVGQDK